MKIRLPFLICAALGTVRALTGCSEDHPPKPGATPDAGLDANQPDAPLDDDLDAGQDTGIEADAEVSREPQTVLIVLEGLRPELVSEEVTPALWQIAKRGVRFTNYFSVLPSNRMAAAASLATGALPARHGVLGERMYLPGATARDSAGRAVDTQQPIAVDDQGSLETLQQSVKGGLLKSKSLIEVAHAAGFRTAVIGRSGPASVFDPARTGWMLNDDYVFPRAFADLILDLQLGLPDHAQTLFPDLSAKSAYTPVIDADMHGSKVRIVGFRQPNWSPLPRAEIYLNPALATSRTYEPARKFEFAAAGRLLAASGSDLLVFWLRDPGETALRNGPSSEATRKVLIQVDKAIGELEAQLPEGSNLIITSDGGSSMLAGDARFFPRWSASNSLVSNAWVQVATDGGSLSMVLCGSSTC